MTNCWTTRAVTQRWLTFATALIEVLIGTLSNRTRSRRRSGQAIKIHSILFKWKPSWRPPRLLDHVLLFKVPNYLTWPQGPCQVKECKIFWSKVWLAGWLAIGIVNLVSDFLKPSRAARLRLPVTSGQMHTKEKTLCMSNRFDEYECQWKSSKFWCKRVDLLSLINNYQQSCRYTHGFVLVIWKPLTQLILCLVDREKPNS